MYFNDANVGADVLATAKRNVEAFLTADEQQAARARASKNSNGTGAVASRSQQVYQTISQIRNNSKSNEEAVQQGEQGKISNRH